MKITDLIVPAVLLNVRVNILILFNLFSRHYLRSMAPGPAVYLLWYSGVVYFIDKTAIQSCRTQFEFRRKVLDFLLPF